MSKAISATVTRPQTAKSAMLAFMVHLQGKRHLLRKLGRSVLPPAPAKQVSDEVKEAMNIEVRALHRNEKSRECHTFRARFPSEAQGRLSLRSD